MNINTANISNLLKSTERLLKHKKEIEKLKGESFNIFSILGMESLENKTHSAFVGELLNPLGSHLYGSMFLELFLHTIEFDYQKEGINPSKAKVYLEYHIGKRDDNEKTGGRIDIFIQFLDGLSISIENKIYAIDQNVQVERYCNYNKGSNRVYYLTLYGEEPSSKSKGDLESGIDFYNISYRKVIVKWLEMCIKETVNSPILRESIKQYIVLLKKLTNSMDNRTEAELTKLFLNHFEAAQNIATNFDTLTRNLKGVIQELVFKKISHQTSVKKDTKIEFGGSAHNKQRYMQIWIKTLSKKGKEVWYGIEGFDGTGHNEGKLFVGIHSNTKEEIVISDEEYDKYPGWLVAEPIKPFDNLIVCFNKVDLLKKIVENDHDFNNRLAQHIVDQSIQFLNVWKNKL